MDANHESRSAKRPRSDSAAGASSKPALTQSSEFWIRDGNIILQAETVQFRVHQGVLERNSSVFKDMFQVGSPDSQTLSDGLPLVEMHDSPADIELLLKALYNRW